MKKGNPTIKYKPDEEDFNVRCCKCDGKINRDDIEIQKCHNCGFDFEIKIVKHNEKIGMLMDKDVLQSIFQQIKIWIK